MDLRDRFRGCLLGLAAGDAVGAAVEFAERGTFEPITDMIGGGPFHLEPGQWTDDTSMALCLATSLVRRGCFDARDQMVQYSRWANDGYLSSTGRRFDIGNTVALALGNFGKTGMPFSGPVSILSAGNGSIMRLAPIPMFFFDDKLATDWFAGESSRTTHGAAECIDCCRLLAQILRRALAGEEKTAVLCDSETEFVGAPKIEALAKYSYLDKDREQIRGSGYVVESLEAALWCFNKTESFEAAVLEAANLGDDADTTAAVCGQVAGAHYGVSGIPGRWLNRLAFRDLIISLADQLRVAGQKASAHNFGPSC